MLHNLFKNVDARVAMAYTAAGTTTPVNGNVIDTHGYDGVAFVFIYGALTATQATRGKAQGGSVSDGSDASDLANSKTALLADSAGGKLQVIDIYRPAHRYVRPVVTRGTANAEILGVIAILYHGQLTPPAAVHSTVASPIITLVQPPQGTA